jgi:hypothetical protein
MSIVSLDGYIASIKQKLTFIKTAARTSVAICPFSMFNLAGEPGAGTLAIGNTANGLVHTDVIAGYPLINAFSGSNTGYISKIEFNNTVASRLTLYDRLFSCGAYSFNSNVTLTSQPSFSSRIVNSSYVGLEIWIEFVTASTGTQSVAVTYTNEDGVTGHTTGTVATVAGTIGRLFRLPLAAGDKGVQKIESVVGSVATVGTFNVHIMRQIWSGRISVANNGDTHGVLKTGMPQIFADSALFLAVTADSTSSGLPELYIEVVNG